MHPGIKYTVSVQALEAALAPLFAKGLLAHRDAKEPAAAAKSAASMISTTLSVQPECVPLRDVAGKPIRESAEPAVANFFD